jgi:hypothetical protein
MQHAFHTSDLGALSDLSGNPAHITADHYPDSDLARLYEVAPVVTIVNGKDSTKTLRTPPTKRLTMHRVTLAPIDDLQGIARSNVREAIGRSHTAGMPRAQREATVEHARMFHDRKWPNLAIAVTLVACAAFMALVLPNFKG